jgi:hypothetical protein
MNPKAQQTELSFTPLSILSCRRSAEDLARRMHDCLSQHNRWVTRREMASLADLNDRECRLARQHSKGKILSGQNGYKLTECATRNEIVRAAATLESQAKIMLDEARELWKYLHHGDTKEKDTQ